MDRARLRPYHRMIAVAIATMLVPLVAGSVSAASSKPNVAISPTVSGTSVTVTVDVNRGPHFSHAVLAFESAAEGHGVVATMPVLAESDLNAARLITPFALRVPIESAYYLVSTDESAKRPAVVSFREWLLAEAARETQMPP